MDLARELILALDMAVGTRARVAGAPMVQMVQVLLGQLEHLGLLGLQATAMLVAADIAATTMVRASRQAVEGEVVLSQVLGGLGTAAVHTSLMRTRRSFIKSGWHTPSRHGRALLVASRVSWVAAATVCSGVPSHMNIYHVVQHGE